MRGHPHALSEHGKGSKSDGPPRAPLEKLKSAWPQIWSLVRPRRGLLAVGFAVMLVNRLAGLVLPASAKFVVDDVLLGKRVGLLVPVVAAIAVATVVQAGTSFALTQLLSKGAQRLIAELRRQVQAHVGRLPVAYYDATKTGALVSRIMNDVEGCGTSSARAWSSSPAGC